VPGAQETSLLAGVCLFGGAGVVGRYRSYLGG